MIIFVHNFKLNIIEMVTILKGSAQIMDISIMYVKQFNNIKLSKIKQNISSMTFTFDLH